MQTARSRGAWRLALVVVCLAAPAVLLIAPALADAQSLPSGWSARDVGDPAAAGSGTYGNGTFTVTGGGQKFGGSADELMFVSRQWTGDGILATRVSGVDAAHAFSKVGIMIRESLAAGSKHASLFVTGSGGTEFHWRDGTDASGGSASAGSSAAPVWLKLERRGSLLTASYSADGAAWTTAGTHTIAMSATLHVGLAVHGSTRWNTATGTFTNVTAGASAGQSDWTSADIGLPLLPGSTVFGSGSLTVSFAGLDIWGIADQFRFVYQPLTGDGAIVTRVASFNGPYMYSKAGLMIRESLAAGSRHGSVFVTPSKGLYFQWRESTNALSGSSASKAGAVPVWLKLARAGSVLTASRSSDGVTWTAIGSRSVAMGSTVHIGFAVSSLVSLAPASATFTSYSVQTGGAAPVTGSNQPPSVSLTSPANGATYTAPATISLAANAADADGTIARVDFYSGGTLLGSDTTAPYAFSWAGVAAGSYSLTAVARDNAGATTVSSGRSVTVAANGLPTHVVFVPSNNDATAVSSYRFDVYPATAKPLLSNPAAGQDLGKPPVVNGESRADIRATISALAPGTYVGVVTAIGQGGNVSSSPSPAFTR